MFVYCHRIHRAYFFVGIWKHLEDFATTAASDDAMFWSGMDKYVAGVLFLKDKQTWKTATRMNNSYKRGELP